MDIEIPSDVQTRLNTLLDYIGTTAKDADGFVREQAPLVAQEIVTWELWSNVTRVIFFLALAACAMTASVILKKIRESKNPVPDEWQARDTAQCLTAFRWITFAVAFVILFAGVTPNAYWAVRATVAPRLVILDYIKSAK